MLMPPILINRDSSAAVAEDEDEPTRARTLLRSWLSDGYERDVLGKLAQLKDETEPEAHEATAFEPRQVADADGAAARCEAFGQRARASAGARISVFDAVLALDRAGDAHSEVYVALNGANAGVLVPFDGECLGALADAAAAALGASELDQSLPKRLYSASGVPITDAAGVWNVTHGLLHVLLAEETWVWPGFEVGFEWTLAGAFRVQTVALEPRILYTNALLAPAECDELIEAAKPRLSRSPTKDYSDAAEFKDFRTSQTAHIGRIVPIGRTVRYRSWLVTRLPVLTAVEETQVVRYGNRKAWFKPHMDVYHNWPGWPDERKDVPAKDVVVVELEQWVQLAQDIARDQLAADATLRERVPEGVLPSLGDDFQHVVVRLVIESNAKTGALTDEWLAWLKENHERQSTGLLSALLTAQPALLPKAKELWLNACADEKLVAQIRANDNKGDGAAPASGDADGGAPVPRKRVVPNRHVTVFHYLNTVERGGETVFPLAQRTEWNGTDTWVPDPRPDVPECEEGLAVRPRKGDSAIFYSRHGDMRIDRLSQHGGCPPSEEGHEKWGANSFSWYFVISFSEVLRFFLILF